MKLPFDLSLKFVFRVLLPGLVIALAFLPLMEAILLQLHAESYKEIVFISANLIGGWLVLLMDMPIYMLYEGRRFWPPKLYQFMLKHEQDRLNHLLSIDKRFGQENSGISEKEFREAWFDIRRFPLDNMGSPVAKFPTRLGNLLAAFESYPRERYNMDAVFYWPRLWVELDKDLREEIDSSQALADSALYTSFTLYFLGLIYLLYALLRALGVTGLAGVDEQPVLTLLIIAVSGFLGGYLLYRLGLHPQASYGERFKALFDLNLSNFDFAEVLKMVAAITGQAGLLEAPLKKRQKAVWLYLQYYRVHPPGAERSIPVPQYEQQKAAQRETSPTAPPSGDSPSPAR